MVAASAPKAVKAVVACASVVGRVLFFVSVAGASGVSTCAGVSGVSGVLAVVSVITSAVSLGVVGVGVPIVATEAEDEEASVVALASMGFEMERVVGWLELELVFVFAKISLQPLTASFAARTIMLRSSALAVGSARRPSPVLTSSAR